MRILNDLAKLYAMRISLIFISTALLGFIFLGFCQNALAKEITPIATEEAKLSYLGKSLIHPAQPLYFLKRIREILELKFAPTSEIQAIRYLEFSQRRIREVRSLKEAGRPDLIPPALEHYLFNLQKATALTDFKNEAKVRQLEDAVSLHLKVLGGISQRSVRTTIFKLSEWNRDFQARLTPEIRDALYDDLSKLQGKICDFLIKEASNSGLNEVEIAVYQERAEACLR